MSTNSSREIKSICCIGAGYVGGPTMAVIAEQCPEIKVTVLDINQKRIDDWNSQDLKKLPIFELGLSEIISKTRGKNLFFSSDIETGIKDSDLIFISVNTPTKKSGVGAGEASDLHWIETCARQIATYSKGHTIVVEKSTIPVRTAEALKNILHNTKTKEEDSKTFSILSNPEFLSEGNALNDLKKPDRVLIGGDNIESIEILVSIYKRWIEEPKIIRTNLWSSELSKLASNAFLSQRISSINSISAICEKAGANINEVSLAIGKDTRIGQKFLKSGPGFGGSCFKKDLLSLIYLAKYLNLPEVANYWQVVVDLNNWQRKRISNLIVEKFYGTLTNKKITILGFTYKANTNDTRESAAIEIINNLRQEKANIFIHDPKASYKQIYTDLGIESFFKDKKGAYAKFEGCQISNSINEATNEADAIIILTEWEEYYEINWNTIIKTLRKPAWIFDTRSVIDLKEIKATKGVNIWQIGMG